MSAELIVAAKELRDAVHRLKFSDPVSHVYNPLDYAWSAHEKYLQKYGNGHKRVIFLGMNPGPFGMAQTGVPFGEIRAVRDWLGITAPVGKPPNEHPKRPVLGFDCNRFEVSGQRLWGLFAERFGTADKFFRDHFVVNYCPLVFMSDTGSNITPDKLLASQVAKLNAACDEHLRKVVKILAPEWFVGIGGFAMRRAEQALAEQPVKIGWILHPSPASPAANRGWAKAAEKQLKELGIW